MKYLIVPTQHFSGSLRIQGSDDKKATKKFVGFEDLPRLVQIFLSAFKFKVFAGLDESSWIKTNTPMDEQKKSQRTRLIKSLERYTESRAIMTGTFKSRSPLNVIDQCQFLDSSLFQDNTFAFAEHYVIMTTLRTQRGRRVQISQSDYKRIRTRLVNAYQQGGQLQLDFSMMKVEIEHGVSKEHQEHIIAHKRYSPFINQNELEARYRPFTMTVERKDVFDIAFDKYVYAPIKRPVEISAKAKKIANSLIEVGFTDKLVLGKAPALELAHRLKDICNGFNPVSTPRYDEKLKEEVRDITYEPLDENPKLEELMELLEEIEWEENQVVVWCYRKNAFRQVLEALEKADIPAVAYSGDESNKQKDEAEALFESGEARVFLANQASAGFGLNCLKKASYMIWYSCGDSAEQHHQAQHRILRGQSGNPKFAYHIYVEHSIEERNIEALDVGQELITDENSKSAFWFD